MRFRYKIGEYEYIVQATDEPVPETGSVEVQFIARVNGGRGRMPLARDVDVDELERLVDFETAKQLKQE